MEREVYKGVVMRWQSERFRAFIAGHPELEILFGKDWLYALDCEGKPHDQAHPLFWFFESEQDNQILTEALLRLKKESPGAQRFVNELKSTTDFATSRGITREAQTYHLLRTRGYKVDWKPVVTVDGKVYRPDLLVHSSSPIYLEIFSITDSRGTLGERAAQEHIQAAINKIEGNPYAISLMFKTPAQKEYAEGITKFIKEKIPSIPIASDSRTRLTYSVNGVDIVEITLCLLDDGIGRVISYGGPGRSINASARIKSKLLDKIDPFQLPPPVENSHLNGFLIFLDNVFGNEIDLASAIKGQYTISFPIGESKEAVSGHASNGVVHDPRWRDNVKDNLHFIAYAKPDHSGILVEDRGSVIVREGIETFREMLIGTLYARKGISGQEMI